MTRKETEIVHVELSLLERLQHVTEVSSFHFGVGKDYKFPERKHC